MKKLMVLFFLLMGFSLWAQETDETEENKSATGFGPIQQTVKIFAAGNTGTGFETYTFSLQSKYSFESKWISASAGALIANKSFDFTTDATFWLFPFRVLKVGGFVLYHYSFVSNLSNTHDVLFGGDIRLAPCKVFEMRLKILRMKKNTELFVLRNTYNPWLKSDSQAVSLQFSFIPFSAWRIDLGVSSIEYFRYNIFCAPTFSFGTSLTFKNGLLITLELDSRWIDFFTLSGNYESTEFRLGCGYSW